MEKITIDGCGFEEFIHEYDIKSVIKDAADTLNTIFKDKEDVLILTVMDGSMLLSADLTRHLTFNPEMSSIKIKSYDGFSRKGIYKDCEINTRIIDRSIIVIEDIIDSGTTINYLVDTLEGMGASDVIVYSLLYKPSSYSNNKWKRDFKFYGFSIDDDFVVGYGMDYNGKGRNFRSIYKKIE